MSRLIVVSNRVQTPTQISESPGGLAIGLLGALKAQGGVWFGWSGRVTAEDRRRLSGDSDGEVEYLTLDLTQEEYSDYYQGFSNRLLWPLCHYVLGFVHYDRKEYEGYRTVNRLFAERLRAHLRDDDLIWVHDYHMIPVAHELRRLGVRNRIGFFLHVPFPCYEMLRSLPIARELLDCLADYDVVGLQTEEDLKAYTEASQRVLGATRANGNRISQGERTVFADSFPIGVDVNGIRELAAGEPGRVIAGTGPEESFRQVVGVDRIDYSKGLAERLDAFHQFLKQNPDYHRQVSLMQVATVSRGGDPDYADLKVALEKQISRINGQYADIGWLPIHYLNRSISRKPLMQLFRRADACLVTSLRDGMNLVSKEYVCAQDENNPGVLILSELAGSARQLDAALQVNPYDIDAIADALQQAFLMSPQERKERYASMMKSVTGYDIHKWRDSFLRVLQQQPVRAPVKQGYDYALAG